MDHLATAMILLAAMVLFVAGCVLVIVGAWVLARALSPIAQGRLHLTQAAAAESEAMAVDIPDREPGEAEALPASIGLDRRPPEVATDAALERAARLEKRTREMLLERAARGDYNVDSNVSEADLVGSTGGVYAR